MVLQLCRLLIADGLIGDENRAGNVAGLVFVGPAYVDQHHAGRILQQGFALRGADFSGGFFRLGAAAVQYGQEQSGGQQKDGGQNQEFAHISLRQSVIMKSGVELL